MELDFSEVMVNSNVHLTRGEVADDETPRRVSLNRVEALETLKSNH
jgi:hypothetical protein